MGNSEFKAAYHKVARDDFDAQGLEKKYEHMLFERFEAQNEHAKFEDFCFGNSLSRQDRDKLFKSVCEVDEKELRELSKEQAQERFRDEVLKDISIGYTTSENKLNQLKQGEFEKFLFQNNQNVLQYEQKQKFSNSVLVAMFYARSRGGTKVDQGLLEYQEERDMDMSSSTLACQIIDSNPFLDYLISQSYQFAQNQEVLKMQLKQLLLQWPSDIKLFYKDRAYLSLDSHLSGAHTMRKFLVSVLEDSNSDRENLRLALKILLRVGSAYEHPELLISCVNHMLKHKIDLSKDIDEWCRLPEVYPFENSEDIDQLTFKTKSHQKLCDSIDFGGDATQVSQMSMSHDAWAIDETHIYNYNEERGLIRAIQDKQGKWQRVVATNKDLLGLSGVSLVCYRGQLLLRHSGLTDRPFVVYNCETLQESPDVNQICSASASKKLDWGVEEADDSGRMERHMTCSPLAYDGRYICAISTHRDKNAPKVIEKFILEFYEIKGQRIHHVKSTLLLKKHSNEPAKLKKIVDKKQYKTEGGLLNHAQLACNGDVLILNFPDSLHFFTVKKGNKVVSEIKNIGNINGGMDRQPPYSIKDSQIAYDSKQHRLLEFQTGVMNGYQNCLSYADFTKTRYEYLDQTVPPKVLDRTKASIIEEIKVSKAKQELLPQANLARSRFRKTVQPNNSAIERLDKNLQNEEKSQIKSVVEATGAIILSSMAHECDRFQILCERNKDVTLLGEEMEPYFFEPKAVHLNEQIFLSLKELIKGLTQRMSTGDVNNFAQVALLAAIKLLRTNLLALRMVKMSLVSILEPTDLQDFKTFITDCLDQIETINFDDDNQDPSVEVRYQKVISWHAKDLSSLLDQTINADSPVVKIDEVIAVFTEAKQGSIDKQSLVKKRLDELSNPRSLRQILKSSAEEMGRVSNALKVFLAYQNSLQIDFLKDDARVDPLEKEGTLFGSVSLFVREYTQVLLVQYGLYCQEIEETESMLKESKIVEEKSPEQINKERTLQNRLENQQEILRKLEPHFFSVFEILAAAFKDFFAQFRAFQTPKLISTCKIAVVVFDKLKSLAREKDSILYITSVFTKAFQVLPIATHWLDEVAEGLKSSLQGLEHYTLCTLNTNPTLWGTLKSKESFIQEYEEMMMRTCYTVGRISAQLIGKKTDKDEEEPHIETLSKLSIIKGGIESRFIPVFAQSTKNLIEGFFKITQDPQLRECALGRPEQIQLTEDDRLLHEIIGQKPLGQEEQVDMLAALLEDQTKLALDVLQQSMFSKVPPCPYARVAGENGLRLTRAAFAAILKLTENLEPFRRLRDEVGNVSEDIDQDLQGAQKLRKILDQVQENKCADLLPMMNRWEQACDIRRWLTDKKSYMSQETVNEAKKAFIHEVNQSDPSYEGKFEGPLSPEQDQLVEDRAFKLLDERINQLVNDVVNKAVFLLQMRVPDEFQQAQKEEKADEARRQMSQKGSSNRGNSTSMIRTNSLNRQVSGPGQSSFVQVSELNASRSRRFAEIQASNPVDQEELFMAMLDSPETRRHKIWPRLWLGNQVAAGGMVPLSDRTPAFLSQTLEQLRADGITHVCCLAENLCCYPDDLQYHQVDLADHPGSGLTQHIQAACSFIDSALASGGAVLVHCNAGVSRSASLVIGWLITRQNMSYEEAVLHVRAQRICINPTHFEDELMALERDRQSASAAPAQMSDSNRSATQRAFDGSSSVFDWADRLQNWQQMQLVQGVVNDFKTAGMDTTMSCSVMVLQCLKADYNSTQLKGYIENQMIGGLRRAAGMNLLNYAMNMNFPQDAFYLLLQLFQSTLRSGTGEIIHYMNKVSGCGENVHAIARKEFFSILKRAIEVLKKATEEKEINHILDAFYWSYKSADLLELAKIDIFKVLQEGDGSRLNPLRLAWGHILRQRKDESDATLTRKIVKVFNFLFKIVLRALVNEDTTFTVQSNIKRSESVVKTQERQQTGLVNIAQGVMQQIFEVLFGNVHRYLDVLGRFAPGIHSDLQAQETECFNPEQDPSDLLIDDFDYIESKGGRSKLLETLDYKERLEEYKLGMIIHTLQKESAEDVEGGGFMTQMVTSLLADSVTVSSDTTLGSMIIKRDRAVLRKLRELDFSTLELPEPSKQEIKDLYRAKKHQIAKIEAAQASVVIPGAEEESKDIAAQKELEDMFQNQKLSKDKKKAGKQKADRLVKIWAAISKELQKVGGSSAQKIAAAYRAFAQSFPPQWLQGLQCEKLANYWTQGGSFFEEEFMPAGDCVGISVHQACVVSGQQEEYKGEGVPSMINRRESRKDLCKKCFWYLVLQNVLENKLTNDLKHLAILAEGLDGETVASKTPVPELINKWLSSAEPAASGDKEAATENDRQNFEPGLRYPKRRAHKKFKAIKKTVMFITDVLEPGSGGSSDEERTDHEDDASLNNMEKLSVAQKRFMWRHLASYFPLQWCLNFEKQEFSRYRIERQGSDSSRGSNRVADDTPFATVSECQGPIRNMVCLASCKNDSKNARAAHDERMQRSQLCRDCYWFMSAINVIMEGQELNSSNASNSGAGSSSGPNSQKLIFINLKKYLNILPDSYEMFDKALKPKGMWRKALQIYDRQKMLTELTFKLIRVLTFEEQLSNASTANMTNLYRRFAAQFSNEWLNGFKAECFYAFRGEYAAILASGENVHAQFRQASQASPLTPAECAGFRKGFCCVHPDSDNGNEAANAALGEKENKYRYQMCIKCYFMRTLLYVIAGAAGSERKFFTDNNPIYAQHQEMADTRAFRESWNSMLNKLPAGIAAINVEPEKLIEQWSSAEENIVLDFPVKNKRVTVKNKVKQIKQLDKLVEQCLGILMDDTVNDPSNDDALKIFKGVDPDSVFKVLATFYKSLPEGFITKFVASVTGSDDGIDSDTEFANVQDCFGPDAGLICPYNTSVTFKEMVTKHKEIYCNKENGSRSSKFEKLCMNCAQIKIFNVTLNEDISNDMEKTDEKYVLLEQLPADLPLFEQRFLVYMYNLVTFKDEKEGDEEAKVALNAAVEETKSYRTFGSPRRSIHSEITLARDSDELRRRAMRRSINRDRASNGRLQRRDTLTDFVPQPQGLLTRLNAAGDRCSNMSRNSVYSIDSARLLHPRRSGTPPRRIIPAPPVRRDTMNSARLSMASRQSRPISEDTGHQSSRRSSIRSGILRRSFDRQQLIRRDTELTGHISLQSTPNLSPQSIRQNSQVEAPLLENRKKWSSSVKSEADSGNIKAAEVFRHMLTKEEEQDQKFFSVKRFINMPADEQMPWLRQKEQEYIWKDIPNDFVVEGPDHGICEHTILLQEDKQFWCDCPFAEDLHYGFSERFYTEEIKPWYRCEVCEKCHCGVYVQLNRAKHGLLTGTNYMVNFVTQLVEARRKELGSQDIGQKLKLLQDIQVAENKGKVTVRNLYHDSFLLRILEMLDFFSSLALTSPASLALIQKFIEPRHLQHLLKLIMAGLPRMKTIAVKIFQNLLSRQIPHEVLHQAVNECLKSDEKVKKVMSIKTKVNLDRAPFFKFIYNLLMEKKEKMWEESTAEIRGSHAFVQELARLFTDVLNVEDAGEGTTKAAIFEVLHSLHELSDIEIETLMTLIPQTNFQQMQKGSFVVNENGQKMTILGFFHKNLEECDIKELQLKSELSKKQAFQYVYGLYFNQKNPERQEVISIKKQEYQVLQALIVEDAQQNALQSPFCNSELAAYFLKLLNDAKGNLIPDKFKNTLIRNYLIRGFSSVISELKTDYVSLMQEMNLSQSLLNQIISLAGQELSSVRKNHIVSLPMLELQTDQLKQKMLLSEESLVGKPHVCHFYHDANDPNVKKFTFFIKYTQEKKSTIFHFNALDVLHTGRGLFSKNTVMKRIDQLNTKSQQKQDLVLISKDQLNSLSDEVLQAMCKAEFVLTSSDLDFSKFLTELRKKILNDKEMVQAGRTSYISISSADFTKIHAITEANFNTNVNLMLWKGGGAFEEEVKGEEAIAAQQIQQAAAKVELCEILAMIEAKDFNLDQFYSQLNQIDKKDKRFIWTEVANIVKAAISYNNQYNEDEKKRVEKEFQQVINDLTATNEPPSVLAIYDIKAQEEAKRAAELEAKKGMDDLATLDMEPPNFDLLIEDDARLGNFATCQFESDEVAEPRQEVSQEAMLEKFNDSIKVPKDCSDYRKLLEDNLQTLTTMHSFNAFQNLIAFGYRGYEDLAKDMEESPEMFQKMCNLIHQELKFSNMSWQEHANMAPLKKAKEKTKKLLDSMTENKRFQEYFVADLMSRSMITVKAILNDEDFDLMDLTLKNMNEMTGSDRALNPYIMNYIVRVILESPSYHAEANPQLCLNLFNLLLTQMVIFCGDIDSKITFKLTQTCGMILDKVLKNIKRFARDSVDTVENFVNNKILQMVCMGLDFEQEDLNERKRDLLNLQVMLFAIHDQVIRSKLADFMVTFDLNQQMVDIVKNRSIFKDGRNFNFMRHQMLVRHVMTSPENKSLLPEVNRDYKTESKMLRTNIDLAIESKLSMLKVSFKTFNADDMMRVVHNNGQEIMINREKYEREGGVKSIFMTMNQQLHIQYPVIQSSAKLIGTMCDKRTQPLFLNQVLTNIPETGVAKQVFGIHKHYGFIEEDESIWGMGCQVQGPENDFETQKLRKIDKPDNCVNYKKVVTGKHSRWILTEAGHLFCNGKENFADFRVDMFKGFFDVTNQFSLENGDKIVDVAVGKKFAMVVTQQGHLYGRGQQFMHRINSAVIQQDRDPARPYKVTLPSYKALKVFCANKFQVAYLLAENTDGKKCMLSAGEECAILGQDSAEPSNGFLPMYLPDNVYFTDVQCQGSNAWAIDQDDNLWTWGIRRMGAPLSLMRDNFDQRTPSQLSYFHENNLKVLKLRAGFDYALVQTQKRNAFMNSPTELYAIDFSRNEHEQAVYRLFEGSETVKGDHIIMKLSHVDTTLLADFACGKESFVVVQDSQKDNQKDRKGIMHAWKNSVESQIWEMPITNYHENKGDISAVSIAIRQPITGFHDKANELLFEPIRLALEKFKPPEEEEKSAYQSSISGQPIPYDQPLYYSYSNIDGVEQKVYLTEAEMLKDGHPFDINPLIYYRLAPSQHSKAAALPKIDLSKFYPRSADARSQIHFKVKRLTLINSAEESAALIERLDPQSKTWFAKLGEFTEEMDSELVRQIDKSFLRHHNNRNIEDLSINDFDCSEFKLSEENFRNVPAEVVKLRAELFIKFTKKFLQCRDKIQASGKDKEGSLGSDYLRCKSLVLATIKNKLLDEQIAALEEGPTATVTVSRRKAFDFGESGQVDHRGEKTIFGQTFQQIKRSQPNFKNFKQKSTDKRCWKINFRGEGSMDYGGPFRDSLVNISRELETGVLPLLIKTPNNRTEVGTNRECFLLNPEANSPTHLDMFHFLGCIIGFGIMSKSPIPLNLAPTVWKQLLGEALTVSDLDEIDQLAAKALKDLLSYSKTMSDEDFGYAAGQQTFVTVLSHGTEVAICNDGYAKQVTRENVTEFINQVVQARQAENKEQISELRRGVRTVLGDVSVLNLMEWHQIETRACGEKTLNIDQLKSITSYPRCGRDHRTVSMFWRVFEERFSEEERQLYLKFVWGRTRLPIDLTNLSYKHEIRLMTNLGRNALPKSHTCFFQLDIPEYDTDELCYARFRLAITMCGEVDIDTDAIGQDIDSD